MDNDVPTEKIEFPSQEGEGSFELQAWPFYWLTRAYGAYISKLEDELRDVELDIPRWRVLMLLEGQRARSVSYLSEEAITKLSTMTRIVGRMQDDGLVETRPRATDARVTEVLLTKHGRRARVLAWQKAGSIYEKVFEPMSKTEVDEFRRLLKKSYESIRDN